MIDEAALFAEHSKPKSPEEYFAKFEEFRAYIDRAREMHPYARANFYELLIDFCQDILKGPIKEAPPKEEVKETLPPPQPKHEPVHHTSTRPKK